MAKFNCLCGSGGRKKKNGKGGKGSKKAADFQNEPKTLPGGLQHPVKSFETDDFKPISLGVSAPFDNPNPGNSRCNKVMNLESPVKCDATETTNLNLAYEGEDEHDESLSMKRDYSDLDLQAHVADPSEGNDQSMNKKMNVFDSFNSKTDDAERCAEGGVDLIQSGHVSDPGIGKAEVWASPKLFRSCSDLEARDVLKKIGEKLPPSKSQSFEEMERLSAERLREEVFLEGSGSPKSVMTHRSADRVMLKKHSSSQVLPSRSRRLWWKLLLWSHRNLQAPRIAKPPTLPVKPAFNQQGGYCSDTLEPNRGLELGKLESPMSIEKELSKRGSYNNGYQSWDDFHGGSSGLWTHNQWIAFPIESPVARVDEWVKELANQPPFPVNGDDNCDGGTVFPPSPDAGKSIARSTSHFNRRPDINLPEEVVHANNAIQSLNSSSKVAHISGIGLKVIPTISCFSSLRCVNLSSNLIVHVTPGSLPKGLHTLNLSRNKIGSIEGFRDLTRLRVLDLSYNRITRIGQGLSNCTLIKELYLAGNKISDVEGLHRLLKLTVLDLSFNKITTAKALGQLVANYNSLLALNLLGNPIQSNISDDQLRKALCSLLPKLAYLNKQPINSQKAREVTTESIARAALGSSGPTPHRKPVRRVIQGGSSFSSVHRGSASISQKSRHRSKSRTHNHSSSQKTKSSALAPSH